MRRVSSIGGDIRYFDRYRGRTSRGGPARIISPVQIFKMLFILLTSLHYCARSGGRRISCQNDNGGLAHISRSIGPLADLPAKLRHELQARQLGQPSRARIQVANLIADTPRTLKSASSRPFEAAFGSKAVR
jgi:hypothetical protein